MPEWSLEFCPQGVHTQPLEMQVALVGGEREPAAQVFLELWEAQHILESQSHLMVWKGSS